MVVAFDDEETGVAGKSVSDQLAEIKEAQDAQAKIEHVRTGASQLTAKLITLFGGIMTVAALGVFGWIWSAQASISKLEMGGSAEHGHAAIESSIDDLNQRIDDHNAAQTKMLSKILRELRTRRE